MKKLKRSILIMKKEEKNTKNTYQYQKTEENISAEEYKPLYS